VRRILIIAASLVVLLAAFIVADFQFPQITEAVLKTQCSMTAPDEGCRARMVSMGHIWALKGNLERAAVWYERATETGNPFAMFHLAWAYEQIGYRTFRLTLRVPDDPDRLAAFNDGPDESVQLLVKANFQTAADWYRKAADKGFAPAMNNLAELYLSGMLGKRDLEEAFRLHLAGARAGNPIAAMNLVLAYKTGMGVARNPDEAEK
jgi:uncharacterized protein